MAMIPNIPADVRCPAELFIAAYGLLGSLGPEMRAAASSQNDAFKLEAKEVLLEDDGQEIVQYLIRMAGKCQNDGLEYIGRVLEILKNIDSAFYGIHPRAYRGMAVVPNWLSDLRTKRRFEGSYAIYNGKALIPRGPLLRQSRQFDAASADSMADRFSALAVAPLFFLQEERRVSVKLSVIGSSVISGVGPTKTSGAEKVGFIPVAENIDDLEKKERISAGKHFVSFSPAASFFPIKSAVAALKEMCKAGPIDIVLMPESVMPARHIPQLSSEIGALGVTSPRLTICGSGDTDSKNGIGMPWNESTILNSVGAVMWRQRKIWPAGFSDDRAKQYGITPSAGTLVMEDNASSDLVEVVDIDSLGRCIVLICQDVLAAPLSIEIIGRFQPDWVFTPILDSGIADNGRWINERLYEFSGISQSRYLVSCSMTYALRLGYPNAGCGLAMGPRSETEVDKGKQFIVIKSVNGFGVTTWRNVGWSTK